MKVKPNDTRQFEFENPAKMPQASKDSMEEYLFGHQPVVPKPFLNPVTPPPHNKLLEGYHRQIMSKYRWD